MPHAVDAVGPGAARPSARSASVTECFRETNFLISAALKVQLD